MSVSAETSVVRTEEYIGVANSEEKYVKTKYWPVCHHSFISIQP